MVQVDLQDPRLFRAMTLRERLAAYGSLATERSGSDPELAAFRFGRWQGQPPFSSDALLDRRLAVDGLDRGRFLHLLGEESEAVKGRWREPLPWMAALTAAYESDNTGRGRGTVEELSKSVPADPRLGFLNLVEPLLARARERLQTRAGEIASSTLAPPFDPVQVVPLFFPALVRQLVVMLGPTLVLEMHVAGLNGLLAGASPPERFASFVERLRTPEIALEILKEYSCLARQVVLRVEQWVESSSELLAHLAADWQEIRRRFGPGLDSARLIGVDGGLGDRHRGGRCVLIASFSGGRRIVYKPRSLAIDNHFQRLLEWLNERGARPDFPILNILDRGSHGWVEYVKARDCDAPADVVDFYERQGGYLALLHALQATDFHYENVIAAGPYPILVDLEALFHPRMGHELTSSEQAATRAMLSSVLRVGLLPQRIFAHGDSDGVDVSGLGAREGQLSPQAVPIWEEAGTNEMRLVRKRMPMHAGRNRPTLDGRPVDSLEHVPALLAGFERIYRLLLEHREALLAPDGPLSWFAGDLVRVIVRPTRVYGLLLQESFHPDLLRDALDRDRHFDRLWLDIESCPYLKDLIPHEQTALANGDIPLFTTSADSRDLSLDDEHRVPSLLEASGLELARERLGGLSDEDLRRQVWLVRATLATLGGGMGERSAPAPSSHRLVFLDRNRLIAVARSVGDRVERLAIRDGDEVGWPGLTKIGVDRFSVVALGADLYDGLPGVALFLAYLGRITGESRYTELARTALSTLRRCLDRQRQPITRIGGFEGWGGIVYALTHLAVLWKDAALLDEAQRILSSLWELADRDEDLDVIAGAAGCIGSLIALHRCSPSDLAVSVAVHCGDRLLACGLEQARGIAWLTRIESKAPLTGFAHGAAGIAWALLELGTLTGKERFKAAAREAVAYERSLFSPQWESWPDLRRNRHAEEDTFTTAWCYGAPGIGLARLRALDLCPDEAIAAEVRAAVHTTLRHGFGFNHSLCHGDLGNLEFLVQAAQHGLVPNLETEWKRVAGEILEEVAQGRPRCATPFAVDSPGLMTGLSGIGYGLLRLAAPELVPSVLLLEPPRL